MIFCLYTDYGALNSKPVFEAFAKSITDAGHTVIYNEPYRVMDHYSNYDVAVIWSVLWNGRMTRNKQVWEQNRKLNRPVIVLEVGGIERGTTWKVGLNGINRDAYFGDKDNDRTRADSLGLVCKPWRSNGDFILVCGQHDKSLQWQNMPRMSNWFLNTYDEIRKYTQRPIVFRPHPRCRLEHIERGLKNVHRQEPHHVNGTYDDFDMGFSNVWATVSYSSNPGTHSCINGVPAFVSTHSLAYDVGNDIDFLYDIEDPLMPDRQQWLNDYAHTEYTIEEISQGTPLKYLTSMLL
jgi:hypothetical protein|tara:strand:+ start:7430 stop:8308 length:879 start_codon:yes stop_codon:yes gene_type:complete